jgi:hypothetical protein
MTFLVLFSQIDEKSSITTNIDEMFAALSDADSGDGRIRHEHDVCHTKIIDGCQNPSSPFSWEDGGYGFRSAPPDGRRQAAGVACAAGRPDPAGCVGSRR